MLAVRYSEEYIDPTVYGNLSIYSNHSCGANSALYTLRMSGTAFQVVFIYTTRAIQSGE